MEENRGMIVSEKTKRCLVWYVAGHGETPVNKEGKKDKEMEIEL